MKKRVLAAVVLSTALAIYLTGCFNNGKNTELGERYDSDKVVKFPSGATYTNENYLEEFHEEYERYHKTASSIQFVVHEKTAIAIAEAVIKEIYPDDDYQVVHLSSYPKALYYDAENFWEVWFFIDVDFMSAVRVCIDVDSGAVNAIIPSSEF